MLLDEPTNGRAARLGNVQIDVFEGQAAQEELSKERHVAVVETSLRCQASSQGIEFVRRWRLGLILEKHE